MFIVLPVVRDGGRAWPDRSREQPVARLPPPESDTPAHRTAATDPRPQQRFDPEEPVEANPPRNRSPRVTPFSPAPKAFFTHSSSWRTRHQLLCCLHSVGYLRRAWCRQTGPWQVGTTWRQWAFIAPSCAFRSRVLWSGVRPPRRWLRDATTDLTLVETNKWHIWTGQP